MKKENFVAIMEALKKQRVHDDMCSEKLKDVFSEYISYNNGYIFDAIIEFLTNELNDKSGWIEHYIYELNFGALNDRLKVYKSGEEIPLKTAEDLWNILQ